MTRPVEHAQPEAVLVTKTQSPLCYPTHLRRIGVFRGSVEGFCLPRRFSSYEGLLTLDRWTQMRFRGCVPQKLFLGGFKLA